MRSSKSVLRILIILLAAAFSLMLPGAASSQGDVVLHLSQETPVPDRCLLDVSVTLENVTNMTAFSLHLTFDPSVVEVMEVSNGVFLQDEVQEPGNGFDNAAGTVQFGMARFVDAGEVVDPPESGSGELVHLRVLALQANTGMKMEFDEVETNLVDADFGPIDYVIQPSEISTGSCAAKRVFLPFVNR